MPRWYKATLARQTRLLGQGLGCCAGYIRSGSYLLGVALVAIMPATERASRAVGSS
jgi:hypothetical protein